jgi:hypothetical protein
LDGTEPRFATYKRTTIHSSGEVTEDTITVQVPPVEWATVTIGNSPDDTTWTDLVFFTDTPPTPDDTTATTDT